MTLNMSRSNLNMPSAVNAAILSRRSLSRAASLRAAYDESEKNNNFLNNYSQFTQDAQWYHNNMAGVNGGNEDLNCPTGPVNPSRPIRYINPFKPHGKIVRQTSFEEPPSNLNRLFSESSVPGVRDIANARNVFRKIFWVFCFTILGVLAVRDISQLVNEYYLYPITVNVRLRDSRRLLFPAVTVCNLNIVRNSALCNSSVAVVNLSMIPAELAEKLCGVQMSNEQRPPYVQPTTKPVEPEESNQATQKSTTINDDINNYGDKIGDKKRTTTGESESYPESIKLERSKRQANNRQLGKTTTVFPTYKTTPMSSNEDDITSTTSTPNITMAPPMEEIELTEREEKELQENLTNWLAVTLHSNEKIAKSLGHQFEDMILRCTIKTTNCTHTNSFEQIFTPTEGNCFTYKSISRAGKRGSKKKQEETSLAGIDYGLELVLNLEKNEYLAGSAQIGALVMVHHPDDFGNSASEAIFVAPQQATFIGLKMIKISRLKYPYPEECIDMWPEQLTGSLTQNATYSQQACLKICLQKTIQRRCNCQSAMLPQLELNSTLKICDTRRKTTRYCVEEVMFRPEDKVNDCSCPPRCQVVNYEKTVSVAKWPTREDRVTFDRGKTNINFQQLAKVVVYFQTMTCQEVIQQPAYTTAKLFSSLGGILGMYVGFSFLSLFEILEVFIRRLWYLCTRAKN